MGLERIVNEITCLVGWIFMLSVWLDVHVVCLVGWMRWIIFLFGWMDETNYFSVWLDSVHSPMGLHDFLLGGLYNSALLGVSLPHRLMSPDRFPSRFLRGGQDFGWRCDWFHDTMDGTWISWIWISIIGNILGRCWISWLSKIWWMNLSMLSNLCHQQIN